MPMKPKVRVPKSVKKGEVFEIKAMVKHPMENGRRKDKKTGKTIPRMIINKMVCSYNGKQVFAIDLNTAVSANPYFSFFLKGTESGEITLTWTDDSGESATTKHKITVK